VAQSRVTHRAFDQRLGASGVMGRSTRVVITGANGFLGRHVCRSFRCAGFLVIPWNRTDFDLTDAAAVKQGILDAAPQVVVHLAAEGVRTPGSKDAGLVDRNVAMGINLVSAMAPETRLLAAGSMTEYGFSGVLSETDLCTPDTEYNRGKYLAGVRAIELGRSRGVSVVVARLFHLFGPREPEHRLLPTLFRALRAGTPVELSDGLQSRDYIHVSDASEALLRLTQWNTEVAKASTVVNVGSGVGIQLRSVAEWVALSLKADPRLLLFGQRERSPADQQTLVADTRKLNSAIGSVPPCRLHRGMDFARLMSEEDLGEWTD
jgi:nucleoside-diphosphate-sugar epimerase